MSETAGRPAPDTDRAASMYQPVDWTAMSRADVVQLLGAALAMAAERRDIQRRWPWLPVALIWVVGAALGMVALVVLHHDPAAAAVTCVGLAAAGIIAALLVLVVWAIRNRR